MANELSTGKTIFILAVVLGCFAILWPKVFYPMITGSVENKPITSPNRQVSLWRDPSNTHFLYQLCFLLEENQDPIPGLVLERWSMDDCFDAVKTSCKTELTEKYLEGFRLGKDKTNLTQCLLHKFALNADKVAATAPPSARIKPYQPQATIHPHARPERPSHLHPDQMHPALREKGRAMPQRTIEKEARPGPMPGIRPPMGGGGGHHMVPPQSKGSGAMGIIMPLYTVGIVIFFMYTIMKVLFKRDNEEDDKVPKLKDFHMDPEYRKYVFAEEYLDSANVSHRDILRKQEREVSRNRRRQEVITPESKIENIGEQMDGKSIGKPECEQKDEQMDQLRRRLEETEKAMERLMSQMGSVTDKLTAAKITEVLTQAQSQAKILKMGLDDVLGTPADHKEDPKASSKSPRVELSQQSPPTATVVSPKVEEQAPVISSSAKEIGEGYSYSDDDFDYTSSEAFTNTVSDDFTLPMAIKRHFAELRSKDICRKGMSTMFPTTAPLPAKEFSSNLKERSDLIEEKTKLTEKRSDVVLEKCQPCVIQKTTSVDAKNKDLKQMNIKLTAQKVNKPSTDVKNTLHEFNLEDKVLKTVKTKEVDVPDNPVNSGEKLTKKSPSPSKSGSAKKKKTKLLNSGEKSAEKSSRISLSEAKKKPKSPKIVQSSKDSTLGPMVSKSSPKLIRKVTAINKNITSSASVKEYNSSSLGDKIDRQKDETVENISNVNKEPPKENSALTNEQNNKDDISLPSDLAQYDPIDFSDDDASSDASATGADISDLKSFADDGLMSGFGTTSFPTIEEQSDPVPEVKYIEDTPEFVMPKYIGEEDSNVQEPPKELPTKQLLDKSNNNVEVQTSKTSDLSSNSDNPKSIDHGTQTEKERKLSVLNVGNTYIFDKSESSKSISINEIQDKVNEIILDATVPMDTQLLVQEAHVGSKPSENVEIENNEEGNQCIITSHVSLAFVGLEQNNDDNCRNIIVPESRKLLSSGTENDYSKLTAEKDRTKDDNIKDVSVNNPEIKFKKPEEEFQQSLNELPSIKIDQGEEKPALENKLKSIKNEDIPKSFNEETDINTSDSQDSERNENLHSDSASSENSSEPKSFIDNYSLKNNSKVADNEATNVPDLSKSSVEKANILESDTGNKVEEMSSSTQNDLEKDIKSEKANEKTESNFLNREDINANDQLQIEEIRNEDENLQENKDLKLIDKNCVEILNEEIAGEPLENITADTNATNSSNNNEESNSDLKNIAENSKLPPDSEKNIKEIIAEPSENIDIHSDVDNNSNITDIESSNYNLDSMIESSEFKVLSKPDIIELSSALQRIAEEIVKDATHAALERLSKSIVPEFVDFNVQIIPPFDSDIIDEDVDNSVSEHHSIFTTYYTDSKPLDSFESKPNDTKKTLNNDNVIQNNKELENVEVSADGELLDNDREESNEITEQEQLTNQSDSSFSDIPFFLASVTCIPAQTFPIQAEIPEEACENTFEATDDNLDSITSQHSTTVVGKTNIDQSTKVSLPLSDDLSESSIPPNEKNNAEEAALLANKSTTNDQNNESKGVEELEEEPTSAKDDTDCKSGGSQVEEINPSTSTSDSLTSSSTITEVKSAS